MNESVLAWCRRIIGCPSVTNSGTREVAEFCLRELLAPHGIEGRLLPSTVEGDAQVNLIARVAGRDYAATPLVLNTHLDTVPPGDLAQWTECDGNPFAATIRADRIYGLGTADTKLDFVAKALALSAVRAPRRDTYLIGSFGEEHGLVGAREIARAGILPRGAVTFVSEPSRLEVITAHKGLMVFRLELRFHPQRHNSLIATFRVGFAGRAAHSSTPALGRNAIRAAVDALTTASGTHLVSIDGGDAVNKVPAQCIAVVASEEPPNVAACASVEPLPATANLSIPPQMIAALARFITDLEHYAERSGPPEPDYASPTMTCNPGVIHSSEESLTLEFELRPPPSLAPDTVRAGVEAVVDGIRSRLPPGTTVRAEERRANAGFRCDYKGETVEVAMAALSRAGLKLASGVKAGCTEAGVYAAAGLHPVVFGPGPSTGVIHAPNEYNLLTEVDAAIRFYQELLNL